MIFSPSVIETGSVASALTDFEATIVLSATCPTSKSSILKFATVSDVLIFKKLIAETAKNPATKRIKNK